jgi:hypothetical protein
MVDFQIWLVRLFAGATGVRRLMHSIWMWPIAESLHFIGLTLLVGAIVFFDLRMLGIGRRIPIRAMHRLIRWGLVGYGINVITGSMFLMAEPDQYIYNPAFQFKLLFMAVAGLNAGAFYLTSYRRVAAGDTFEAPASAKVIAAVSVCMWLGVIIAGRLLTFYRPYPCGVEPGFISTCIPGFKTGPGL